MTDHPRTGVHSFAMLPARALSDPSFGRRFRVLGAVCKAVENATATATISQARIAELTGMQPRKIRDTLHELEQAGYLTVVSNGRRARGQYRVHTYVIHFDGGGDTGGDGSCSHRPHGGPVDSGDETASSGPEGGRWSSGPTGGRST